MDIDLKTVAFELLNFVVLMVVFARFLFKPVREVMRRRREEIEQAFDRRKHTEIKWFEPGELEGIDPARYVPDFQDSVRAAVALYRGEEPVLRGPVEP